MNNPDSAFNTDTHTGVDYANNSTPPSTSTQVLSQTSLLLTFTAVSTNGRDSSNMTTSNTGILAVSALPVNQQSDSNCLTLANAKRTFATEEMRFKYCHMCSRKFVEREKDYMIFTLQTMTT